MKHRVTKVQAKTHSAAVTATGELYLWGVGVFGSFKTPQKVLSISNSVVDVCLGGATLGAAIDVKGMLWTWGSNVAGELGLGDNDPKVHPYPVMALKKKHVTNIACGGQFIVALGSNLKKEIPTLKLQRSKRHRRNEENLSH
jgi:X-linked retinitis pigmentosa GTPase regulator